MTLGRRGRTLALLVACAAPWSAARSGEPTEEPTDELPGARGLEVPFVVNCGPPADEGERPWRRETEPSVAVLPDIAYSPSRGYGHESGEGFRHWNPGIWGAPGEVDLFASGRRNPESYRFRLPQGRYLLAIGLCELEAHQRWQRVFDVEVQGETAWSDVDPFELAGFGQAVRLARAVEVSEDGELSIVFRRRMGEPPIVNAIWVHPPAERGGPPGPPEGVRGVASYGMNVLFWRPVADPGVKGVLVERCGAGENTFRALEGGPFPTSRRIDGDVLAGRSYQYRVRTVDVEGRTGEPTEPIELRPRRLEDSSLPLYRLEVSRQGLAYLLGNVRESREATGLLFFEDDEYPMRLELRGQSSRHAPKKSYRVELPEVSPLPRRNLLYLKAEPFDPTFQQEKLTADVFSLLGLPVSAVRYVNVALNSRYEGVYADVEPVRRELVYRLGLRPDGMLLRTASFGQLGHGELGRVFAGEGSLAAFADFTREVNRVERGDLEAFVRARTDWKRLRDYLVASVICHRSEIEADDNFFHRDPDSRKWTVIPWDLNNGNFGVSKEGVGRPFMPLFGQSAQGIGDEHDYWYVLPSRIFNDDALRREYLNRLEGAVRDVLLSGRIDALIDRNFGELRPELSLDPFRWPPGDDRILESSAGDLKRFARRHGERLLDLIAEERSRPPAAVVVSELLLGAEQGWIELNNRGERAVSLEGYSLQAGWRLEGPRHQFSAEDRIPAGGYRVFPFERRPARELDPEALERLEREDPEAAERLVLEARRAFPGFDARGGTISLLGPRGETADPEDRDEPPSDDRPRERRGTRRLDLWYYGPQTPGFSYGRSGAGFGSLRPTPGEANGPALPAPPLLADGGASLGEDGTWRVRALVTALEGGTDVGSLDLEVRYRIAGEWRGERLEVRNGARAAALSAGETAEAGADIDGRELPPFLRYYFVARSADGVERPAPLTAPEEWYFASPLQEDELLEEDGPRGEDD